MHLDATNATLQPSWTKAASSSDTPGTGTVQDKLFLSARNELLADHSESANYPLAGRAVDTLPDVDDDTFVDASKEVPTPTSATSDVSTTIAQILESYGSDNADRELLTLTHPNGIFGHIMSRKPDNGKKIARQRLAALAKNINETTWYCWSKNKARARLTKLTRLLDSNKLDAFLTGLADFEQSYQFGLFQAVLNAGFRSGRSDLNLLTPIRSSDMLAFLKSLNIENSEQDTDLPLTLLNRGPLPEIRDWNNPFSVFRQLLTQRPEVVKELLIDLLAGRARQCKQNGNKVGFAAVAARLDHAMSLQSDQVSSFIDTLNDQELEKQLQQDSVELCVAAEYRKITETEFNCLTDSELTDLNTRIENLIRIRLSLTDTVDQGEDIVESLKIYNRAIQLIRLMRADHDKPLTARVYMLAVPSTKELIHSLTGSKSNPIRMVCEAAESYRQHMLAYSIRPTPHTLRTFQQSRHDFRMAQENALLTEAKARISTNNTPVILSTGSYQGDRERLIEMDRALQRTAPVRPVSSKCRGYMQLCSHKIWNHRDTIQQRLGDLQHHKDLIDCGYDFSEELVEFAFNHYDKLNVIDQIAGALAKVPGVLDSIRKGETTIWGLLFATRDTAISLQKKAQSVLEATLAVAERNPRLFRRMVGDSVQSTQQLLSVLGINHSSMINTLQTRLQTEAAASVFAGDTPVLEDLRPEDIATMKQFQMLCDLADMAFRATTVATAASCLTSSTLASKTGTALGAIVGGVIGGLPGVTAGMQIGSYTGAAVGAAVNAGAAIATREAVNQIDGKALRTINRLVNSGPMAPFSQSGWDQLAQFGRSAAQRKSLIRAAADSIFAPEIFRLKKLTAAIRSVYHREQGAIRNLAWEGAKCLLIAGATAASSAIVASTVFYTSLITIAMSPFLTASLGMLASGFICGHRFSTFVNNMEYTAEEVGAALNELQQLLMPAGSVEEERVEKACREEATNLTRRLATQGPYQQYLAEETAIAISRKCWGDWCQSANSTLLQEISQGFQAELAETKQERLEVARELVSMVQARTLLKNAQGKIDRLTGQCQLEAFRKSLEFHNIHCPPVSDSIDYFIEDKLLELEHAMIRLAGTSKLPTNVEAINKHLARRQLDIIKGDFLRTLSELDTNTLKLLGMDTAGLKLPVSEVIGSLEVDTEKALFKQFQLSTTTAMKERMQLMLKSVAGTLWAGKQSGTMAELSEDQLNQAFALEKARVHTMQQCRKDHYRHRLQMAGLSNEAREKILATTAAAA